MNTETDLKSLVRSRLLGQFPSYVLQFESAGEDQYCLGVGVYGVECGRVRIVESSILDIDEWFCAGTPFVLIPLVRSREVTMRYYPHLARPWTTTAGLTHSSSVEADPVPQHCPLLGDIAPYGQSPWNSQRPAPCGVSTDELPLAA